MSGAYYSFHRVNYESSSLIRCPNGKLLSFCDKMKESGSSLDPDLDNPPSWLDLDLDLVVPKSRPIVE